jgi:proteasome assembly chaperone (PAC2) family protein
MGNVAISAGYYLMAKLGMHLLAEFSARELFEMEHVEVKGGLIRPGRLPRSRLFVWMDPEKKRDIIVFIGEAQPPRGKYAFCHRLIEYARQLGVDRVFTFAAMATQMHPGHDSRVFGAATDGTSLNDLKQLELELLEEGHIGGLNGVLLGAAADVGLRGSCLLGEMPHVLAHIPFPKAALAVLKVFSKLAEIELDTTELSEQAQAMDKKLGELLAGLEQAMQHPAPSTEEPETPEFENQNQPLLHPDDERLVERLFKQAGEDRSTAYELKRELDRLGVFPEYEDRFLDLFQKPE